MLIQLDLVQAIEALAKQKGCTAAQLALAWVLSRGEHVIPIPGTRIRARLEENTAATTLGFTADELQRLEAIAPKGAAAGPRYGEALMQTVGR